MIDKLYTVAELAEYLAMNPQSLNNWRTQGYGPAFVKVGRNVRYREGDITDWLESQVATETAGEGW